MKKKRHGGGIFFKGRGRKKRKRSNQKYLTRETITPGGEGDVPGGAIRWGGEGRGTSSLFSGQWGRSRSAKKRQGREPKEDISKKKKKKKDITKEKKREEEEREEKICFRLAGGGQGNVPRGGELKNVEGETLRGNH